MGGNGRSSGNGSCLFVCICVSGSVLFDCLIVCLFVCVFVEHGICVKMFIYVKKNIYEANDFI